MNSKSILKTSIVLAGMIASLSASAQGLPGRGQKTISLNDKVGKNQVVWLSDAPVEKIKGTAESVFGKMTLDPANPSSLRGAVMVNVATMKTGNPTRDAHLVGADWLDAAKYPNIMFTVTSVSGVRVNGNKMTANATGKFSLHGVDKTMTVPIELTYMPESDKTRERAPGDLVMLTATFNISLKDFNITGTRGMVGSKVGESIQITAKLFGSAG